jgi:hypothetical protein
MKADELSQLLEDRAALPVNLKGTYRAPVTTKQGESYLGPTRRISTHNHDVLEDLAKYQQSVFGTVRGNPSEPDLKAASEAVFHFSELAAAEPHNLVNTREGHGHFLAILARKEPQTLFVLADRGLGKTFYLNYVLNTQTYNLYNDHKLVIYRVDASKLYTDNAKAMSAVPQELPQTSLRAYLYLHIAYVTFQYHQSLPVWAELLDDRDGLLTECLSKVLAHAGNTHTTATELVANYKAFLNDIAEELGDQSLDKATIQAILSRPAKLVDSEMIAKAILHYLVKRNFRPVFMFDQLDNIDLHIWRPLYDRCIFELSEFCHRNDAPNPWGAHIVIALRRDTYNQEYKKYEVFFRHKHEEFYIKPHEVDATFKQKSEVFIRPTPNHFKIMLSNIDYDRRILSAPGNDGTREILGSFVDLSNEWNKYADTCIKNTVEAFKPLVGRMHIGGDHFGTADDLIRRLYNGNWRVFLCNMVNLWTYYVLFVTKKDRCDRPYVYTEGVLLDGNLYLNSAEPRSDGQVIPNLFWFEKDKADGRWHGLCLVYLLGLLAKGTMIRREIVKRLVRMGYARAIVEERLNTAIEYGLVRLEYAEKAEQVQIHITPKGRVARELPFVDVDIFYYMALDTPLVEAVLDNSKCVRYHVNGTSYWGSYTEACVLTSMTLVRHIVSDELTWGDQRGRVWGLPGGFPECLFAGMLHHVEQTFGYKGWRYDQLVADLEGLTETE